MYDAKIKAEILNGSDYELGFRHWLYNYKAIPDGTREFIWDFPTAYSRARYILLAFQTECDNKHKKDCSKFDFCDLNSVQVQLNNSTDYPKERPVWKKSDLKYSSLYTMFKDFQISYYSKNAEKAQPLIDMKTFVSDYPIICLDCSKKPDVIKDALININIRIRYECTSVYYYPLCYYIGL